MNTRRPNGDGGEGKRMVRGKVKFYRSLTVPGMPRQFFYGDTPEEAKDKYEKAEARMKKGAPVKDSKSTVGEWVGYWLAHSMESDENRASTNARDRSLLLNHVIDQPVGRVTLDKFQASDVRAWKTALKKRLPADSSRHKMYLILRKCLDGAVADKLLAENPLQNVDPPSIADREMRALTIAETARLFQALTGSHYRPVLSLIGSIGLRKGEALALQWEDVDYPNRVIHIRHTYDHFGSRNVKTLRSKRDIPMNSEVEKLLKAQRISQVEDRLRAADQWQVNGHVFTTEAGTPLSARNTLRAMTNAAKSAGLVGVNVHTLRHTVATRLIENGWADKAVADLLGHTDTRTTARYTHPSSDYKRDAMNSLSGVLGLN